jgi:predicted ArsR family transcriptional regulator
MPFGIGRDFRADNRAILNVLKSGRDFTANQLRTKLEITNVSARINDLRNAGYPIYLNTKETSNGRKIRVYRIGSVKREDVAIARAVRKNPGVLDAISNDVQNALSLV